MLSVVMLKSYACSCISWACSTWTTWTKSEEGVISKENLFQRKIYFKGKSTIWRRNGYLSGLNFRYSSQSPVTPVVIYISTQWQLLFTFWNMGRASFRVLGITRFWLTSSILLMRQGTKKDLFLSVCFSPCLFTEAKWEGIQRLLYRG